jgi:hypothetical protein
MRLKITNTFSLLFGGYIGGGSVPLPRSCLGVPRPAGKIFLKKGFITRFQAVLFLQPKLFSLTYNLEGVFCSTVNFSGEIAVVKHSRSL